VYGNVIQANTDNDHAVLDFSKVPDMKGNTWNKAGVELGMAEPLFAAIDAVGPMKILSATFTASTKTVEFKFNHPLYKILNNVASIFEIQKTDGTFVPFTASQTLSTDKMTLTIELTPTVGSIDVGDEFDLVEDAPGTYDDALANGQLEFVFRSAYAPADDGVIAYAIQAQ
jgi:hypothetical protein